MNTKIVMILVLGITVSMLGTTMIPTPIQYADARVNPDKDGTGASGGGSIGSGGLGFHTDSDSDDHTSTISGGGGINDGLFVGGSGGHESCDTSGCEFVGGSGFHIK